MGVRGDGVLGLIRCCVCSQKVRGSGTHPGVGEEALSSS
jgi:hypothetical protein|eukprot:COSAG01_NODE_487_length_16389_cov_19.482014_6_plen_39_part_00